MVYKHANLYIYYCCCIYALHGEDAAKRGGWRLCIKLSWKLNHWLWKNHGIVFLNFCGNPVAGIYFSSNGCTHVDTHGLEVVNVVYHICCHT